MIDIRHIFYLQRLKERPVYVYSFNETIELIPRGVLCVLLAFAAFLALLPSWLNYDIISRDGAFQYVPIARLFLEQKFHDALVNNAQLPLFPLIIASVSKLTGLSLEMSGRVTSYLAYIVAALGMFKMADFLFKNRFIALLAFLFLITNRQLINRSIDCLKESLFLCCVIWGNYLIFKGISSAAKKEGFYVSGTFILLVGAMFRSTVLVFICAWLMIWIFHDKKGMLARASSFLALVIGVLAAWLVYPEFIIFQKGSYHLGYFFDSTKGLGNVLKSSADVLKTFLQTGNPAVILFGLYGLYHYRRDAYFYHINLILILFFFILTFWIDVSDRYYLAPIVWLYPLAGYGIVHAFRSTNRTVKTAGLLTVISCIVLWAHISLTPPDSDRLAWREAGEWILAKTGPDREVISNRDRLVFYAQGVYIPLSAFQDKAPLSRPLAVDGKYEGGEVLITRLHSLGLRPDKRFGSISVYLPRPGY